MIHFSNKPDPVLPQATLWEMTYHGGMLHITIHYSQPTLDGETLKTYPGQIQISDYNLGVMDPRLKFACEITARAIARNEGFNLFIPEDYFWEV